LAFKVRASGRVIPVHSSKEEIRHNENQSKDATHLFFRSGNWTMVTRILTGQFPNYKAILPDLGSYPISAQFSVTALRSTIERVAAFADERSHAAKFEIGEHGLQVSAKCTETGEASELVTCETVGTSVIGFNANYVLDVLKTQSKDAVMVLRIKDYQTAGALVPVSDGEFNALSILMPIRLDGVPKASPVPVAEPTEDTEDDDAILAA
jgi:DNA polymerase III subunit beta